jgi:putative oxidoreductase
MNPDLKRRLFLVLEWICRLVVAGTFLLAAVPKLLDPVSFAKAIVNYRVIFPLIGQGYVYPAAMFMPALEAVGALALLFNRWRRAGSLICGALLVLFIVLVGQAVIRGLNIDCGCFGTGAVSRTLGRKVGLEKILENTIWLAACVFVWTRGEKAEKLKG